MHENDPHRALGIRLAQDVINPMKRTFVGKDEVIDLLGICLVAGENLFILGPPGTAKTALVHELGARLDANVFDYLLTRFTEPNELFGPFDIRRLREGDLVTNTEGMLPEASFVFLDELLNANSAILNSLLMVLNERIFRRGRETRKLPLLMVVGASNCLPEEDALAALFDRFLMRVHCDNVSQERLADVLEAGWKLNLGQVERSVRLTADDIRQLQNQLRTVDIVSVRPAYLEAIARLRRAGIPISDRRAVRLQRLIAASALLCGRSQANGTDLWVLRYIWETEEQQEVIAAIVDEAVAAAKSAIDGAVHPRAHGNGAPDAEELARDLERLAQQLKDATTTESMRSTLRDQLGLLAGRCQWVAATQQQEFLNGKVAELWTQLGEPT
jgi:MoxR-like ATPase